ncbi:hypothetical protein NL489_27660 [Klebsiella pneumoniae]|nr:hypothetical protein [Klebsiella pneumoniae]
MAAKRIISKTKDMIEDENRTACVIIKLMFRLTILPFETNIIPMADIGTARL